jgi:hypothetical protein
MSKGEIKRLAMKGLERVYKRAKQDLVLLPRSLRIWIDIIFAIVIFSGMVILPLYSVIRDRKIEKIDVIYMVAGTFLTLLFLSFANRARKKETRKC